MTDRALWRVLLRRAGRTGRDRPAGAEERRAELVVGVVSGLLALGALVAGSIWGNVRPSQSAADPVELQAAAWSSALVFSASGIVATRRLAAAVGHAVAMRTIRAAGVAVRLLSTITGYVVVFFAALGLLSVSVTHILTAGALTGVVLGIAAQQSLGNVFAGLVLLFARPFTVGDHIRVRSGALGGLFDGVVLGMSLTYVTLSTEEGLLKIPNSALLAAAVGPFRQRPSEGGLAAAGTSTTVSSTGAVPVIAPAPAAAPGPPPAPAPAAAPSPDPWRELAEREDDEEHGGT
jgi:small-conductance mechanosensitive channel